nr:probable hydrolase PNKD [Pelodiscus sinensis]|eukprot:XP_025034221.1 probable hydrolase PNKD [Pelodiscus sinensis]
MSRGALGSPQPLSPVAAPCSPGHEYAQECLMFASLLEPENPVLEQKLQWVTQQRLEKRSTCPSTIREEKEYNPFLRTHCRELHRALGLQPLSNEDWESFRARVLKEITTSDFAL